MRKALALMLGLGVIAGAVASVAVAGGGVKTNAGFAGKEPDGLYTRFYGDVDVKGTQKCVPDRKVDLYRQASGDDVFIGRTRSDTYNFWSITIPPEQFSAGTYYVKAQKRKLKNGTVCLADRSNKIVFN